MSLFKYHRVLFRNNLLQRNTLKLARYSTSDKCGSGSDSGNQNLVNSSWPGPEGCNSPTATCYDSRKYGHNLPGDDVQTNFDPLPEIPRGVFRCTAGEVLGNGRPDGTCYQNPEYFSFHHMTYFDMHKALRKYRLLCPQTGRKK